MNGGSASTFCDVLPNGVELSTGVGLPAAVRAGLPAVTEDRLRQPFGCSAEGVASTNPSAPSSAYEWLVLTGGVPAMVLLRHANSLKNVLIKYFRQIESN